MGRERRTRYHPISAGTEGSFLCSLSFPLTRAYGGAYSAFSAAAPERISSCAPGRLPASGLPFSCGTHRMEALLSFLAVARIIARTGRKCQEGSHGLIIREEAFASKSLSPVSPFISSPPRFGRSGRPRPEPGSKGLARRNSPAP